MVSCVFISMVCIPSAHADDTTGSIDLNVQSSPDNGVQTLNDDAPVVDDGSDGSLESEYPKDENGNPINPWKQVSCSTDGEHTDCRPYYSYTQRGYIVGMNGPFFIWKYDSNSWYCIGVMSVNGIPQQGAIWENEYYGRAESNKNGVMCFHISKKAMTEDEHFNTAQSQFHEVKAPENQSSITRTFQCEITIGGEMPAGCPRPDDYNDGPIGWDSLNAGLISVIRYPKPPQILSSFPMTGEYTLPIVVSLVLIAGITIIFIHRYGGKHND